MQQSSKRDRCSKLRIQYKLFCLWRP